MNPFLLHPTPSKQRGGVLLGFVLGLLTGLALALVVAVYVTKTPVPFIGKAPTRTAQQEQAEQSRNQNWDPNAGLQGRASAPRADASLAKASAAAVASVPATPAVANAASAASAQQPAAYFVQAGAYSLAEEAQSQRAKLALQGIEAKVTEHEQSGRTVYRVRVGPLESKEDAERTKTKVDAAGYTSVLVRTSR